MWAAKKGFTIVELLIVVLVIAILAAITIVSYNGITARAQNSNLQSVITQLQRALEVHKTLTGSYPVTQSVALTASGTNAVAYADAGCQAPLTAPGSIITEDWIPGLETSLPSSSDYRPGPVSYYGCFIYQSDGNQYILSAWNMAQGGPQTNSPLYRRIGFREMTISQTYMLCNHVNIGGANPTPYNEANDYYKHSFTITNFNGCNETPPSGA